MSALSRRKGAAWQAELAKRWRDRGLFVGARSTQGEQAPTLRGAKRNDVPDIEGTPYWVEAKHKRQLTAHAALEQAEDEATEALDARTAIAVVRPHGCGPDGAMVCMRIGDWEALVRLAQLGAVKAAELAREHDPGLEADYIIHGPEAAE